MNGERPNPPQLHAGRACSRCGGELGFWHYRDAASVLLQEHWGCSGCGVSVMCGGEHQATQAQAPDVYVSMMR